MRDVFCNQQIVNARLPDFSYAKNSQKEERKRKKWRRKGIPEGSWVKGKVNRRKKGEGVVY